MTGLCRECGEHCAAELITDDVLLKEYYVSNCCGSGVSLEGDGDDRDI